MESNSYEETHIRRALYRPFNSQYLYFDNFWNEERYQQHKIYPIQETELENKAICVSGIGGKKPFQTLTVGVIPDLHLTGDSQCFPYYTYDEDGSNRRENITDWALNAFRKHNKDDNITKWDIFHYNYGLLHHPEYREKYQANLKRDLPHIPYVKDFWGFANAGARLAETHVNYESQPEYDQLKLIQNPDVPLNWRVEKMKLSKDKTSLIYNDFLTIDGIPPKTLEYRLGTRSALEWIVNQYCVKTDKRSGIVNDPNREDDPQYIVRLIGQVITVSLETVDIVAGLPALDIVNNEH
jgi:predicted helicase